MTVPTGTALVGNFKFYSLGSPYNPTPAPTVVQRTLPDGTTPGSGAPALSNTDTGVYQATAFSAGESTLSGGYEAVAYTSDPAVDNPQGLAGVSWEVGTNDTVSIAAAVWAAGTRSLTTFGTLVADVATAVWGAVARTITGGAIDTNNDKSGYDLSGAGVTAVQSGLATIANQTIINNNVLAINPLDGPATAAAVLDALSADHLTPGTVGYQISLIGASVDQWLTDLVAGGYTGDEAGALIVQAVTALIDISGRLPAALIGGQMDAVCTTSNPDCDPCGDAEPWDTTVSSGGGSFL